MLFAKSIRLPSHELKSYNDHMIMTSTLGGPDGSGDVANEISLPSCISRKQISLDDTTTAH